MTFAAVGTIIQTITTSLTVNPAAVGNLVLFEVQTDSQTIWCTSISGGHCDWTQIGNEFSFAGANGWGSATVFAGKAITTGSATATLTFNGAPSNILSAGQQFSSTTDSWALDGPQGNLASAGTGTMPSLTPSGAGELYFCFANDTFAAVAGSTSGYTYQLDTLNNAMVYNAACTAAAQAPVWGDSTEFFGIAVLMRETVLSRAGGSYQTFIG